MKQLRPLSVTVNALTVMADVVICAAICLLLNNSRTGFLEQQCHQSFNGLCYQYGNVDGLLRYFIIDYCCESPKRYENVSILINLIQFPVDRFYANSLLATLNARKRIRGTQSNSLHALSLHGGTKVADHPINGVHVHVNTITDFPQMAHEKAATALA
ncbi:hypothetical protein BT96DRAFT_534201 [Gymnopus androsaceus JB14]|uniref:DUF6534 domain-containing protein n=1 Tax=Gymnopus androsaceus JB14 TaxID=1447944 RepID=A0A6A4IGP7_9AGAR|nr:hypothetical protein BT96DRAFT_534201 [Gymnopus androsaceus JB14]